MPTLYQISIPVLSRGLGTLSKNLARGQEWADDNKVPHEDLLNARLFPDMLTLIGQVQRASDTSRFVAVRVGGIEPKPMADEEKTFDDLQTRIAETRSYLDAVPATSFDGKDGAHISFKAGSRQLDFNSTSYILGFAIPNFYFHVTTAYDIMRHKGVPLSKTHFLGGE